MRDCKDAINREWYRLWEGGVLYNKCRKRKKCVQLLALLPICKEICDNSVRGRWHFRNATPPRKWTHARACAAQVKWVEPGCLLLSRMVRKQGVIAEWGKDSPFYLQHDCQRIWRIVGEVEGFRKHISPFFALPPFLFEDVSNANNTRGPQVWNFLRPYTISTTKPKLRLFIHDVYWNQKNIWEPWGLTSNFLSVN